MKNDIEIRKLSILIVDDTPENIAVLRAVLMDQYTVRLALDGDNALRIAHTSPPPALILLDIMMPGMDGYEVIARLRAESATRDIPVIFITGLSDMQSEVKGLQAGAVDYITKPFNPLVVLSRVATHLALHLARQSLEIRAEELLRERTLVENIIIRMRSHRLFDDRHLRYLMASAERSNGDILLSAFTPVGRQWILVGDFTGHGLQAAVAAPLIAHIFYAAAAVDDDIETTVAAVNDVLYRQLPTEIFMAGCVIEISAHRDAIRLWNAAMPECILLGRDGSLRKIITSTGIPPFGIVPEIDVSGGCVRLPVVSGEKVYIFSDGITETMNLSGELFGLNRMLEHLLMQQDTAAAPDELIPVLELFHDSNTFNDDITLVEIRM